MCSIRIGDAVRDSRTPVWLERNLCGQTAAFAKIRFLPAEILDANPSCGNVDAGSCAVVATCVIEITRHGGSEMNYLSLVVNQRPMLRVSGQILLAFCCATPLVLLLCFLV